MSLIPSSNKHIRRLKALGYALRYPKMLRDPIKENISYIYKHGHLKKCKIPAVSLEEICKCDKQIIFQDFNSREGNLGPYELMVITSLIAENKPKNLLEIGTFDGNTTLQMALNAPKEATIHTIDLPPNTIESEADILEDDIKFIMDEKKSKRKYQNTSISYKVIQHLGDSTAYDFSKFTIEKPLDFCFIDGGHSYDCVRKDTEKVLSSHINPELIILWHDFDPNCSGVYTYLCSLGQIAPIKRILGTSLAYLKLEKYSSLSY